MNVYEMLEAVKGLPFGDYAEAGVWQGRTAKMIADGMSNNAALWLFDSFEGHAEPHKFDNAKHHPKGRYYDTKIADVHSLIPAAHIVAGFIPDSFKLVNGETFRFVHIDLDHYLPTKAACEFFKGRMVPGGIIRFDDYLHGETPGATKAINEVFGEGHILESDYRWIAPNTCACGAPMTTDGHCSNRYWT